MLLIFCLIFNRLLDREQAGDEESTMDDEEEDEFLKAFKVCLLNFVYLCCTVASFFCFSLRKMLHLAS